MPDTPVTIPSLPAAGSLTGAEQVPVEQSSTTVRTTTAAIAALAAAGGGVTGLGLSGTPRTGTIVIAPGSNITITESPTNTFTFAAAAQTGQWLPVTWNTPSGGTAVHNSNGLWTVTNTDSSQRTFSDIVIPWPPGAYVEIRGLWVQLGSLGSQGVGINMFNAAGPNTVFRQNGDASFQFLIKDFASGDTSSTVSPGPNTGEFQFYYAATRLTATAYQAVGTGNGVYTSLGSGESSMSGVTNFSLCAIGNEIAFYQMQYRVTTGN